jgi:hypothetical protein
VVKYFLPGKLKALGSILNTTTTNKQKTPNNNKTIEKQEQTQ